MSAQTMQGQRRARIRPVNPDETLPAPLEMAVRPAGGLSLFWRTFVFLALLLLSCMAAWVYVFRVLEVRPQADEAAQRTAALFVLSRAALANSDPIERLALVQQTAKREGVAIALRQATDSYADASTDTAAQALVAKLPPGTPVVRGLNGQSGVWVGLGLGQTGEKYWLQVDKRADLGTTGSTWLVLLATALGLSLLGAGFGARLINRPLRELSFAASRLREGNFSASRLNEAAPTPEIREVNVGFNRMADQLAKVEQDRATMLAGISHDLRTPLARLRLETEISVADASAREHMAADIEQLDRTIDKFLDYARPERAARETVCLNDVLDACIDAVRSHPDVRVRNGLTEELYVLGDEVDLTRVVSNLIENARRYGKGVTTGVALIDITAKVRDDDVSLRVRDHGIGVGEQHLSELTKPFYRGDAARTAATGAGLGLAIVEKAIARMGGGFRLTNAPDGGLVAHVRLLRASRKG